MPALAILQKLGVGNFKPTRPRPMHVQRYRYLPFFLGNSRHRENPHSRFRDALNGGISDAQMAENSLGRVVRACSRSESQNSGQIRGVCFWRVYTFTQGKLVSLKFHRNVSVEISTQRGTIPMESPFQH